MGNKVVAAQREQVGIRSAAAPPHKAERWKWWGEKRLSNNAVLIRRVVSCDVFHQISLFFAALVAAAWEQVVSQCGRKVVNHNALFPHRPGRRMWHTLGRTRICVCKPWGMRIIQKSECAQEEAALQGRMDGWVTSVSCALLCCWEQNKASNLLLRTQSTAMQLCKLQPSQCGNSQSHKKEE